MSRPPLMSPEEIDKSMKEFPLWDFKEGMLIREIASENFADAVGKLNTISIIAEKLDHHPDLLLYGWNKLRVSTKTHDKDGITELDFGLAKKIEELNY